MDLVYKLEDMRQLLGFPMIINSGCRCTNHNRVEGGKPNSAHLTGEAADIKIVHSLDRHMFLEAARVVGIKRRGLANTYVHVDISTTLPTPRLWLYQ